MRVPLEAETHLRGGEEEGALAEALLLELLGNAVQNSQTLGHAVLELSAKSQNMGR